MVINGWENNVVRKDIFKYKDGTERFQIGNVICFNTLKNPNLIWSHYGACFQEDYMMNRLEHCIKQTGLLFDLPVSTEIDIDGFARKPSMMPFTIKEIWCKDIKRVDVAQSMFFVLRRNQWL